MMTKRKKRIAKTISITELFRKFPTEQSCIDWLEESALERQAGMPALRRR